MKGTIDKKMLSAYFSILFESVQSENPESIRFAAIRSLKNFSPVLVNALRNPSTSSFPVPAFFILVLLLSDDSFEIRTHSSELASTMFSEPMAFTPMAASEKLCQVMGESLEPCQLEKFVVNILCQNDMWDELRLVFESSNGLFAKERQNVWRDEIYEYSLYIEILSGCWSRQMSLGMKSNSSGLVHWAKNGVSALKTIIERRHDVPLGWSHEIEVFESVMKLFKTMEVLLRYGRAGELTEKFEELKEIMTKRKSHELWIEKIGGLLSIIEVPNGHISGSYGQE